MDKSKAMMVVIIILLLALIGTVVGVAFYMMTFLKNVQSPDTKVPAAQVVRTLTPDQTQEFELTEPIVTNLAPGLDGKSTHMASVGISINIDMTDKTNSQKFYDMISSKGSKIQDICLGIIRQMTFDEVSKADSQAILKKDILDALRAAFESNLIYDVDITGIKTS